MIEAGHEHYFQPVEQFDRPDGKREVHRQCICGLEDHRVFEVDGTPLELRYRYAGLWIEALDLARLMPVPTEECETCGGRPTLVVCEACAGLGVTEGGQRVGADRMLATNPAD